MCLLCKVHHVGKGIFWTRQGLAHCCGVDKAEGSSPRRMSPLMTFQVTKAAVCEQQSTLHFQRYCCYLSANWWCPMPRQWYQAERLGDYCRKDQWSGSPQLQGILVDIPSFLTKVSEILTLIAVKQRHKNCQLLPHCQADCKRSTQGPKRICAATGCSVSILLPIYMPPVMLDTCRSDVVSVSSISFA